MAYSTNLLLMFDGAIEDSSPNQVALTNDGVTISSTQSKFGGSSAYFNGSSKIQIDDSVVDFMNSGYGDFTIDWWEYQTASHTGAATFHVSNGQNQYGLLLSYENNSQKQVYISKPGETTWTISAAALGTVKLNTWVHRAVTRTNNKLYCFENGVLQSSTNINLGIDAIGNKVIIGQHFFNGVGSNSYYEGYLDALRISRVALWTANFTPPVREDYYNSDPYVWDVYSVKEYYLKKETQENWHITGISSSNPAFIAPRAIFNVITGIYRLSGYQQYSAGDYPTMTNVNVGTYQQPISYYCESGVYGTSTDIYPKDPNKAKICTSELTPLADAWKARLSSSSQTEYPENGTTDKVTWYTLRGAPTKITYPLYSPPNKQIRITWEGALNGDLYRVQRSTDNGSTWVTLVQYLSEEEYTDDEIDVFSEGKNIIYRVCNVGDSVESNYITGETLVIQEKSSLDIKTNNNWEKIELSYKKVDNKWVPLTRKEEKEIFTTNSRNIIRLI